MSEAAAAVGVVVVVVEDEAEDGGRVVNRSVSNSKRGSVPGSSLQSEKPEQLSAGDVHPNRIIFSYTDCAPHSSRR